MLVLDDPVIKSIASEKGCTAAQVCLAWARQRGIAVVTKSEKAHRIKENLDSQKVELTEEDIKKIYDITEKVTCFKDFFDNLCMSILTC